MFLFFSITVLALLWPDSPLAFYTLSCSRRATCCSLMSSSLPLSIRFVRTKRLTVNYGIREYNIPWNHHCLRGSNVCGFRGSMNLHVYPHEHTYKHLFFKYLFKLSLPTKLRPYNEESFGYPQTLPPPPLHEWKWFHTITWLCRCRVMNLIQKMGIHLIIIFVILYGEIS